MITRRLVLALTTAVVAGGLALSAAPAAAQGKPVYPTVYRFSISGSVKPGATKLNVPGDVKTKKSRGGRDLGKVSLAVMVRTITDQAAKGRSVGGTITIKGVTRPWRGLPVLMDDGTVKIRVTQGRGTRGIVLTRKGPPTTGTGISCPPGTQAYYDEKSGGYTCKSF